MKNKKELIVRGAKGTDVIDTPIINLKFRLKCTDSVRVVSLPGHLRLSWLAEIIMECFGFDGSHRYSFDGDLFHEEEEKRPFWERLNLDEYAIEREEIAILHMTVEEVFSEVTKLRRQKVVFSYDYGDGWKIEISRMADSKQAKPYVCRKSVGMNAIEDCGGPWGLQKIREMLETFLLHPSKMDLDEEEKELLDWVLGWQKTRSAQKELACKLLEAPSAESISEWLKKYAKEDVSTVFIPHFYSDFDASDEFEDDASDDDSAPF